MNNKELLKRGTNKQQIIIWKEKKLINKLYCLSLDHSCK